MSYFNNIEQDEQRSTCVLQNFTVQAIDHKKCNTFFYYDSLTLFMAGLWKYDSQFSGKPHGVLKWTGYQSKLTGEAVESRRHAAWVSPTLLQIDTARVCTFH